MTLRNITIAILALAGSLSLSAQSLWTSAELKHSFTKQLGAYVEGEHRTYDGLSSTNRWAGTVGVDFKQKYFKLGAGYTYIYHHTETETTRRGNIIPAYWIPKHRVFAAITGRYSFGRLELSLRERYQLTHRGEKSVAKYDSDGVTPKADELITAKDKHILRSRIMAEYNIRKCRFTPWASIELYSDLENSLGREKIRYTIGTDYSFNKKNALSLFYRYIDNSDSDENAGHIIGVGYTFKL